MYTPYVVSVSSSISLLTMMITLISPQVLSVKSSKKGLTVLAINRQAPSYLSFDVSPDLLSARKRAQKARKKVAAGGNNSSSNDRKNNQTGKRVEMYVCRS